MTMKPKSQAITAKMISDLFVAAFGGRHGCWYWCHDAKLIRSDNEPTTGPWYADPAVFAGSFEAELEYDLVYADAGGGLKRITQDDVRRALDVMARKYPKQFAGDEHAADALIQCVVYGYIEIITSSTITSRRGSAAGRKRPSTGRRSSSPSG